LRDFQSPASNEVETLIPIATLFVSMEEHSAEQVAVDSFKDNDIADLCVAAAHNMVSDEPRTLTGTFPGNKTLAMGYALEAAELVEEAGLEAEREYVGETDADWDQHLILIHIEGGDQ